MLRLRRQSASAVLRPCERNETVFDQPLDHELALGLAVEKRIEDLTFDQVKGFPVTALSIAV
jgi:hypothetical protein